MKIKNSQPFPVYPLLFAASSVLSLIVINIEEMELSSGIRTLVVSLVFSAIFLLFSKLCFRNWHKAAFFTLVGELVFISYGQVFDLLQKPFLGLDLGHHSYLAIASFIILGLAIFISARMKTPVNWTKALNFIFAFLLLIPIGQIAFVKVGGLINNQQQASQINTTHPDLQLEAQVKPDIYYIILDTYTREDTLLTEFKFDNSKFLNNLKDLGFFVASCSRSNYAHTRLSLASSLNLDYLPNIGLDFTKGTPKLGSVSSYVLNNLVENELSKLGYKTVAFQTGYVFTDKQNADYYIQTKSSKFLSAYIEPFEFLFLQNTAFRIIINTQPGFMNRYFSRLLFQFSEYQARIQNIFKELPKVAEIKGPKFVFVHLDIPHHPFVFLPDGSINPDQRYYPSVNMPGGELDRLGYVNQVQYVNNEIIPIVEKIQKNSEIPPIIILQGDHGLGGDGRVKILNAIYLPGKGIEDLYPSISPVNTFRVIFNNYFGTDLPLLEDRSYFSGYEDKMDYKLVPETSTDCLVK